MNPSLNALRAQYGCGPIHFSGTHDALFERHLLFDRVIDPGQAAPHDHWEAAAHALARLHIAALAQDRPDL